MEENRSPPLSRKMLVVVVAFVVSVVRFLSYWDSMEKQVFLVSCAMLPFRSCH